LELNLYENAREKATKHKSMQLILMGIETPLTIGGVKFLHPASEKEALTITMR
jgi:hypothetical protein